MVEKIKEMGKSHGMSLNDIERACGIGVNTIYKWDRSCPQTDKLSKVADLFGVTVDYLLGRESQKISPYDVLLLESYNSLSKENREFVDTMIEKLRQGQK